jgi:DNA-binding MarR family transcriptional regulator
VISQDAAGEVLSSLSGLLRTSRSISQRTRDLGATGTALGVLKVLEQGDARPGDLAATLHVDPSVISRAVAPLEQEALVVRKVHPGDARASLLGLTALGRSRSRQVQQIYIAQLRQTLSGWSDREAEEATAVLQRLDQALTGYQHSESHHQALTEALTSPTDRDPPSSDDRLAERTSSAQRAT